MAVRPEKYTVKLERWTATTRGISKGFTIHVLESEHHVGETSSKSHWLARIDKSQVEQKASEQGFDLNVDGLLSILQSCLESSGPRPLLDVEECTVNVNKIPANDCQQSQQTPWAEFLEMPGHLDYSRSSRLAGQTYMPSPFDGILEVSFRLIVSSDRAIMQFRSLGNYSGVPMTLELNFPLSLSTTRNDPWDLKNPCQAVSFAEMQSAWWAAIKKSNVLACRLETDHRANERRRRADERTIDNLRQVVTVLQGRVAALQQEVNQGLLQKSRQGDTSILPVACIREDSAISARNSNQKSVKLKEPLSRKGRSTLKSARSDKTRPETECESQSGE